MVPSKKGIHPIVSTCTPLLCPLLYSAKSQKEGATMTSLDHLMQLLVIAFFLVVGVTKIFSYRQPSRFIPVEPAPASTVFPYWAVALLGLLEIAAALALFTSATPALIAAVFLALLTVGSVFFRLRRQQSAAPTIAVFLMVVFVIVDHWFHRVAN
jgi:uncharacterized membrane protein